MMSPSLATLLALLAGLCLTMASTHLRAKRELPDCYIVEILAFVDVTVWDHWRTVTGSPTDESVTEAALRDHYTSVYNEVDERFMSIDKGTTGICIRAYLTDVIIAKTAAESSWSNQNSGNPMEVQGLDAIAAFQAFHKSHSGGRTYDYAQGITRKTILYSQPLYYKGLSYLGTSCQYNNDYSLSIVEDNDAHTPLALAQHMGHFLGANHDSTTACSDADHFIMSAQLAAVNPTHIANTFLFSTCSVDVFKGQVGQYNCLTDHAGRITTAAWEDQSTSLYLGRLYDLDEQCSILVPGSPGFCDTSYDPDDPTTWEASLTPDICTDGASCTSPAGGCVLVDIYQRTPCQRTQDTTTITNYECNRGACAWASEEEAPPPPPPPPPPPGPGMAG